MSLMTRIPGLTAVALLGTVAVAAPTLAQTDAAKTDAAQTPPAKHDMKHHQDWSQHVEGRIADLHKKLQITSAQEELWGKVAQTMRDNATAMSDLVQKAQATEQQTSAIEDLQNYQKIAQEHADGAQRLVSAFQPLYDAMSADQKKVADTVFEHHRRGEAAEGHKGHKN